MLKNYNNVTNIRVSGAFTKEPKYRIAIFSDGFTNSKQDEYLIKIAETLDFDHHRVSIFACNDYGEDNAYDAIHPITGQLRIQYLGQWIPNSLCGLFRTTMRRCKAIWMVLQVVLFNSSVPPEIVFVHADSIVLPALALFSKSKTIFVYQYPIIPGDESNTSKKIATTGNLNVRALLYAHIVLVENNCLKKTFKRFFPEFTKGVVTIYPSHDTSEMVVENLQINKILPHITNEHYIFTVFGDYNSQSNFELVLDALESIHLYIEGTTKDLFYLVVAGNCDKSCPEQLAYYRKLVERTNSKVYKNQVMFLKQACTALRKALLVASVAVIHPVVNDVYPGPILEAMSIRCAVIATNTGFAKNTLEHQRTALLMEPRPFTFSEAMFQLVIDMDLRENISSLAYHKFIAEYCHDKFKENLGELLWKVKRLT